MLNSSSYISHQSDHFNHQCFLPSCKSYHLNTMVRHFFKYFIDNCQLEYVSEHKHIGIQLSSNLSWSEHNADIVKKTFKLSFILLSLFWIRIVRDIKMVDIQEVNVDCVSKRCWRADEQVIIIMNNPAFISITLSQKIFNTGSLRHPIFAIHVMVKENKTLKRAFPSDKALTGCLKMKQVTMKPA